MEDWREGVDLEALNAWMERQGLGQGEIVNVTPLGGGTQNILLHFERGGRPFVLRRPPLHLRDNSNKTMRREMRVLGALAGSDVPHPGFIAGCPEEDVLGVSFYLMEPIDGFAPTAGLPALHAGDPDMQRRMGFSMVDGIAALGAVDYLEVGLDGFGRPDNYLQRQVGRWRAQLDSYAQFPEWPGPGAIPGVDKVAAWLRAHQPDTFEPGILHGDYHLGNVMFRHDGPQLAAIVDWELCTIGDPLLDLGELLATWPDPDGQSTIGANRVVPWDGFPTGAELVERYRQRSHRDLSAVDWYVVLACYRLGLILEGTYARACAGKAPRATGEQLHAHTILLFERALSWIH